MIDEIQGDIVNEEWLKRHHLRIPHASGVFESGTAWVKINTSGTIIAASEKDSTFLAELVKREVLDEHHAYYARVFLDMRNAFRRRVSYKSNAFFAAEFFGSDMSDGLFETCYLRVCRAIIGKSEKVIRYCLEPVTIPEDEEEAATWVADFRDAYHPEDAFDKLVSAIDAVREWADEQRKT